MAYSPAAGCAGVLVALLGGLACSSSGSDDSGASLDVDGGGGAGVGGSGGVGGGTAGTGGASPSRLTEYAVPGELGPYPIGFVTMPFIDENRPELATTDPADNRTLPSVV